MILSHCCKDKAYDGSGKERDEGRGGGGEGELLFLVILLALVSPGVEVNLPLLAGLEESPCEVDVEG